MNSDIEKNLIILIRNPEGDITERINAVRILAKSGDKKVIPLLKESLKREKPIVPPFYKGSDLLAPERIVDVAVIEALHQLGDDTYLHEIVERICQASDVWDGPYQEIDFAANAVLQIGQLSLIGELIKETTRKDLKAVKNIVKTLVLLKLPLSATHNSINHIPSFSAPISMRIKTLKEEFETLVRLSGDALELSKGTQLYLSQHDYERGMVEREEVTLRDILEKDLNSLNFEYFTYNNKGVVICTFEEAGQRWWNWWQKHSNALTYRPEESRFILKGQN